MRPITDKYRIRRIIYCDPIPEEAERIARAQEESDAELPEILAMAREGKRRHDLQRFLRTLKAERRRRNVPLDEIGACIGMDAAALQAMEDSDNPDLNAGTLLDYARAVGFRLTLEKIEPRTNAV